MLINLFLLDIFLYILLGIILAERDGEKLETVEDFLNILKGTWKKKLKLFKLF